MKQILGYIECDYMNLKRGILYTIGIFTVISAVFSLKSSIGAVGYMLFGGLIVASTVFTVTPQTLAFADLAPGSTLQKVLGRYLGSLLIMILLGLFGMAAVVVVRLAGFENGGLDLQLLAAMFGISLFFLSLQNMLLYLLIPMLGMQFANIIRMLPGFVMFFLVMQPTTLEIISGMLMRSSFPGLIILGIGAVSLAVGVFLSYLIMRRRVGR